MPYAVDATGREPAVAVLALRGLVAITLVAVLVGVLLAQYRGAFRPNFPATAVVADVGDGVARGADVKLRGMLVGTVAQVRTEAVGGVARRVIDLQLRPDLAGGIPATVRARVLPLNIFGVAAVELVEPPGAVTTAALARDAAIPGDESAETVRLQSVLDRLTDILRAVRPAELNTVLSNISQSLNGRGERIGTTIGRLDGYLGTLNGRSDDFSADLALLASSLEGLADAAPALLDTVDNAVVTSATLVSQQDRLAATLAGTVTTTGDLDGFLGDNADRTIRVARSGAGFLRTVAEDADDIPRSLANLGVGADALSAALGPDGGGLSLVVSPIPFVPYTAADCPRYGRKAGPHCVAGRAGDDPAPDPAFGGSVGPVGGDAEAEDLGELMGGADTGDAGALLLGPIVRGSTVGVR